MLGPGVQFDTPFSFKRPTVCWKISLRSVAVVDGAFLDPSWRGERILASGTGFLLILSSPRLPVVTLPGNNEVCTALERMDLGAVGSCLLTSALARPGA